MSHKGTPSEVMEMRSEHDSLQSEIDVWRDWWEQLSELGQPHLCEMGTRLNRFRKHLIAHFSHEESLVGINPPDIGIKIAQMQSDHASLLHELDQLIARLTACEPDFGCWGDARRDFERFLDRLGQHETAERELWGQVQ